MEDQYYTQIDNTKLEEVSGSDDMRYQYTLNNTNIEIQQGNFSSWKENKDRQDNFEIMQNEKLQKDINRLEIATKNTAKWSNEVEKSKNKKYNSESTIDKGYVGHKSAKMMKKSKVMERKVEKAISEKTGLLKNIDRNDSLKIIPLESRKNPLIIVNDLQIKYNEKPIFSPISFEVTNGDRIAIAGKNGTGKSSILKLIIGEKIQYDGEFYIEDNNQKRKMEAEDIGYVLSTPNVPEFLTAREFLKFFIDINLQYFLE